MAYTSNRPRRSNFPKAENGTKLDPSNESQIQSIIDKYSGGKSPLKAKDFIEVSTKYGVPIDLMLAQAIQESNIGTKGMAVRTKNIFNVGNNGNTGKTTDQGDFKKGLERYARLIRDEYSVNGKVDVNQLLSTNFKRPKLGGNYAEEKDYATNVAKLMNEINPGGNYKAGDGTSTTQTTDNKPKVDNTVKDTSGDYTPKYIPITNTPSGAIETEYGKAHRQPAKFSDKVNLGNGERNRGYLSPLAIEQIAPELLTMATNKRDPVNQQTFQPELKQTFDLSYQLGRNENQSTFNTVAKIAEMTGNMDVLNQMAAQKYKADEQYNVQEIQGNASQKLQVYNANTDIMNDARLKNLAALDAQQTKQAQADFNTRREDLTALTSIAGKKLQNDLENKTYNAYANLFKHYGFDKKGNVTFNPDDVVQKFNPGEAQQFGLLAAQKGVAELQNATKTSTKLDKDGEVKQVTKVDDQLGEFSRIMEMKNLDDAAKQRMLRGNSYAERYYSTQ